MKVVLDGCCQSKCFVDIFTFISQLWKKQSWQSLFVNYIKTQQLHVMLNDSEVLWTKVESNWRARITFCLTMKNNSCRVSSSVEVGNSWYLLWNIEKFQILIIFGFQFWTKKCSMSKEMENGNSKLSFFSKPTLFSDSQPRNRVVWKTETSFLFSNGEHTYKLSKKLAANIDDKCRYSKKKQKTFTFEPNS